MKQLMFLRNLFFDYHPFFTWRDGIEIIFFTVIIYSFSLWLKKDNHKNLLGYFYAYCSCFFLAQSLQLTTISHLLLYTTPITVILFIVFHQFTLQKNFVTLRALTHPETNTTNWLETLIQTCLITINKNKEIICVIEHIDSLRDHLTTPLTLHAHLTKELLNILMTSDSFDSLQMIWLNSQGKILGINAQWNNPMHEEWTSETAKKMHQWKQNALFYTEKTDALVFKITPATRFFDIVAHGKAYDQISAPHTISFITKYLTNKNSVEKKGEPTYVRPSHSAQKQSDSQYRH